MASDVNGNIASFRYCQACGAANPVQATSCAACHEPFFDAAGNGLTTNPLTGLLLPAVILYQRYRVLEVMSTGEVSTLYRAEDIQLGNRVVALKEIGKNNAGTQEAMALIEEARSEMLTLAGLVHPNLPRVYDYFVENHRWYFVMDFLAGESLAAYLDRSKNRHLPEDEVLETGIQLARLLDYLHIQQPPLGFHDLALDTIWRAPDGKLSLLEVGAPAATAAMPQRTSIYSLGKLLSQLQHGKAAGKPGRPRNALLRLRQWPARFSSLSELLRQMVHKDAVKRPYTMGMVKQELQHLATQRIATKRLVFSRRMLLRLGGLAALALVSNVATQFVGNGIHRQVPHPTYSPGIGGTLYSYDTTSNVLSVAWSPDGRRIVFGARDQWNGGEVQAWDAGTGQRVVNYRDPNLKQEVQTVIWLPNGASIVAGGDDGYVYVWEAATGNRQGIYDGHGGMVITVASSPDSRYIASGGADKTVQVWEVATGNQLTVYLKHTDGVGSVAWSPDGKYIASASFDKTVQVWEAATGKSIYTYHGHTDKVYAAAWSPDGKYIASGGLDKTVQVWSVALFEGKQQGQKRHVVVYRGHNRAIQDIAWSPNSRTIASAADNVQLWNPLSGEHIFTYSKHAISAGVEVQSVGWSPNGKYIASGGMEGTVQVWNATGAAPHS